MVDVPASRVRLLEGNTMNMVNKMGFNATLWDIILSGLSWQETPNSVARNMTLRY
jgi:hypothetical protein